MGERRRVTAIASACVVLATVGAAAPGRSAVGVAGAGCRPSAASPDAPTSGNTPPPAAPSYLAADFPRLRDTRLGTPLGGFGGLHRRAPMRHTPVVFVHGNQADGQNWLSPMLQFQRLA